MSKIMRPFQPTRPLRGATLRIAWGLSLWIFQPTRPLRGATRLQEQYIILTRFQPTRPLRGATGALHAVYRVVPISTHAPLAGRDWYQGHGLSAAQNFNPRAPCGARPIPFDGDSITSVFQPTRPLRGATGVILSLGRTLKFQPPRPLRGATDLDCQH